MVCKVLTENLYKLGPERPRRGCTMQKKSSLNLSEVWRGHSQLSVGPSSAAVEAGRIFNQRLLSDNCNCSYSH